MVQGSAAEYYRAAGDEQAEGSVNNKSNLSPVEQSMTFAKINTHSLH